MRSCWLLLIVASIFAGSAAAQTPVELKRIPPPDQARRTSRPATQPGGPQGEKKLRWICRRLRLDGQQMQQAEALIAVYNAELKDLEENAADLLQRIQDKYSELQAAKADGDSQAVARLQDELRNLAPGVQAENHFFDGLMEILTEQQKAQLPVLRAQADRLGEIALRPIHVVRAARKLSLSFDQQRQLEQVMDDYREAQARTLSETPQEGQQRVEKLIQDVRTILTPEQAAAYDAEIEELRAAPPAPNPVNLTSGQPSGQPTTRPQAPPRPGEPPEP